MAKLTQRLGLARYEADDRYRRSLDAFQRRDLKAAFAEVELAAGLLPNHAEYHAAMGFYSLEGKDGERAGEAFDRALELNPYEMLAHYGLGMMAYRAKDWRGAEDCFMRALAAQPDRPETQYYLAMIAHRLGDNDVARRWMGAAAANFAGAEDSRERHCSAWQREFHKLLELE